MKLRVLYFARLRDQANTSEEPFDAPPTCTVRALMDLIGQAHPSLGLVGVRAAVNEEFVQDSHRLGEGDVVALIPPVSGG